MPFFSRVTSKWWWMLKTMLNESPASIYTENVWSRAWQLIESGDKRAEVWVWVQKLPILSFAQGEKIQWDCTGERRSLKFAPLGENCPFKILFAAVPRWWRIYHMNQGLVNNVYPIKSKTSPCSSLHLIAVVISKPYKI